MKVRTFSVLRTKRPVWLFIAGFIIIFLLVYLFLQEAGVLGPIRGGQFSNRVIIWKISDHGMSNEPLQNDINGTDVPKYNDEGIVVPLQRDNSGNLVDLLRFQGEFEYRSN